MSLDVQKLALTLSSIDGLSDTIKSILNSKAGIDSTVGNTSTLEGRSLAEVEALLGDAGIALLETLQGEYNAFVARTDNPHGITHGQIVGLEQFPGFGLATEIEAVEAVVDNKLLNPTLLQAFWDSKVGDAPEDLDTIQELAEVLQNNPEVINIIESLIGDNAASVLALQVKDQEQDLAIQTNIDDADLFMSRMTSGLLSGVLAINKRPPVIGSPGSWVERSGEWHYIAVDRADLRAIVDQVKNLPGQDTDHRILIPVSRGGETHDIPLNNVVTTHVTAMNSMFSNAPSFNQDISSWDTSNVTTMSGMFDGSNLRRSAFNQDISGWDVSNVTNMQSVFYYATSFNQDISQWNVSAIPRTSGMLRMFNNATSFNQDLSPWCVSNVGSRPDGFDDNTPAWTLPKPVWGTCPDRA